MAAETDSPSSHVVIDMDAGPICVVCMEPMEWVAVTPCGHREVCARCAANIRFFHKNIRCCICRSYCSIVVVTKANRASGQRGYPFLSPLPPAYASEVLGGHFYWYHSGMGAYFDDLYQYEEITEFCKTSPSPSSEQSRVVNYVDYSPANAALSPQPAASVNVNLNVSVSTGRQGAVEDAPVEEQSLSSWWLPLFLLALLLPLLATLGVLMVAKNPYPKVLIALLVSALSSAFTACSVVYAWRKFSNNSLQCGRTN